MSTEDLSGILARLNELRLWVAAGRVSPAALDELQDALDRLFAQVDEEDPGAGAPLEGALEETPTPTRRKRGK